LGSNIVYGVSAVGNNVYAATSNGLSFSFDGGTTFAYKTTADGLSSNTVNGVYALADYFGRSQETVYVATSDGLSIYYVGEVGEFSTPGLRSEILNGVYVTPPFGRDFFLATADGLGYSRLGYEFFNWTTANGLGSNTVNGVYGVDVNGFSNCGAGGRGSPGPCETVAGGPQGAIYAATSGGLSVMAVGSPTFVNYTTADGLGSNNVRSVYVVGGTVFVGTSNGLSVSTNGVLPFTRYTNLRGTLGSTQALDVSAVYVVGSTVYAASAGSGLGIST
jgi:hypothetical protein